MISGDTYYLRGGNTRTLLDIFEKPKGNVIVLWLAREGKVACDEDEIRNESLSLLDRPYVFQQRTKHDIPVILVFCPQVEIREMKPSHFAVVAHTDFLIYIIQPNFM